MAKSNLAFLPERIATKSNQRSFIIALSDIRFNRGQNLLNPHHNVIIRLSSDSFPSFNWRGVKSSLSVSWRETRVIAAQLLKWRVADPLVDLSPLLSNNLRNISIYYELSSHHNECSNTTTFTQTGVKHSLKPFDNAVAFFWLIYNTNQSLLQLTPTG